jgi:hypothetical protein
MLICGHTHASPEPRPTGLRKHTQTCTVHEKVPSTQPNATLTQSACNEGCPTDPARASRLVTQRMQEFHCRLAQAPGTLQGEGHKGEAVWLDSCIRGSLLLVVASGSCPSRSRRCWKGVDGWEMDDGDVNDGDAPEQS